MMMSTSRSFGASAFSIDRLCMWVIRMILSRPAAVISSTPCWMLAASASMSTAAPPETAGAKLSLPVDVIVGNTGELAPISPMRCSPNWI